MKDDCLSERVRAEDIILGTLGFDNDARIIKIKRSGDKFEGMASWPDGEQFKFESEDELSELEIWALTILEQELNEK